MAVTPFGRLLVKHQEVAGLNSKMVAEAMRVSGPLVSQWINGKKKPTSETIGALANLFDLSGGDREKFFKAAEIPHVPPRAEELIAQIEKALGSRRRSDADRRELVAALDDAYNHWEAVRSKCVRHCVIPTAGWQARWLGHAPVANLVKCVAEDALEAMKAANETHKKFKDTLKIIVVLRRGSEIDLGNLKRAVTFAWQDEPRGTAHSVETGLQQANVSRDEPFAVFFPDERVSKNLVEEMVRTYNQEKASVVAVRRVSRKHPDKFGSVTVKPGKGRLCQIVDAVETIDPGDWSRQYAIVGRYVFSPYARRHLSFWDKVHEEVSLTQTVAQLAREHLATGFKIPNDRILSIVSERTELEKKVNAFVNFTK